MNFNIRRILGFEQFQDLQKIMQFLKNADNTQDFSDNKHLLFEDNKDVRLWVISSKTDVYIISDNGFDLKVLLKRKKSDFKFDIIKEQNSPRLFIKNTITTLPINTSITGGTDSFKSSLNTLIAG
jgi:hypothetical protein